MTFATLADAVRFIADNLAPGRESALASACREPLPAEWVLDRLRETHAATPLPLLYAGREFPADAATSKLGGHDSELGHIHIDFALVAEGWAIDCIWMCR